MEKKSSNIKSDWFYGECVTSAAVHWWRRNNGAIAVNIGQLRVFAKRKAAVHTKERRAVCAARFGKLKKKNIRESKKKSMMVSCNGRTPVAHTIQGEAAGI